MKKLFFALVIAVALTGTGCKKNSVEKVTSCNLPSTAVPATMTGSWASGYNSATSIVDAYNGAYLGNAFQSGKYFHFNADGKYAEFFLMVNGGLSFNSATKAIGTVTFDEEEGSFIFHCCQAHFRGWQNGTKTVDRDATPDEIANQLTRKFYYSFESTGGITWMQIRFTPDGTPTSFENVD